MRLRTIAVYSLAIFTMSCQTASETTSANPATNLDLNITQTRVRPELDTDDTPDLEVSVPPTLTETPAPTTTVTSPTPIVVSTLSIFDDFLFNEDPPSTCVLPCWQGLIIGQSNIDDVLVWFDTKFNLQPSQETAPSTRTDMLRISYAWLVGTAPSYHDFAMSFWLDPQSTLLQYIVFVWGYGVPNVMSPQRIIEELGPPSHWFVSVEGIPSADIDSVMFYERGFIFSHTGLAPSEPVLDQAGTIVGVRADFCLSSTDFSGDATISQRLTFGPSDLPPLLEFFYSDRPVSSIEELSGKEIGEIAQLSIQNPSPCVTLEDK